MFSKEWKVIKMNVGDRCIDHESGYYSISFISNILSGEIEINKLKKWKQKRIQFQKIVNEINDVICSC